VVEKAAGVIWNLAHEDSVRTTIRQLGGLKPLIDLLSHLDPLIRFNTVGAFPLLTEQTENRTEAFDLGVIPPLVNILANDANHVVLQNAAQSIGNLADDNSQYQNAIREGQGLLRLVELFQKFTRTEHETGVESETARQELLAKVCFACWLICERNEVNQKAFRDAGGMPALVKVLNLKYDAVLLEMAAGCICALCENFDSNKVAVRECEGLRPLIDLLEYGTQSTDPVMAERALDVQLNTAKALAQLAENAENKALIRELGGLERLVKLLSGPLVERVKQ
jgi:HEAT repeat protein